MYIKKVIRYDTELSYVTCTDIHNVLYSGFVTLIL